MLFPQFAMERKQRILVVDDDPDACELISTVLGQLGFEVGIALDGFAALGKLARSPFDLVLTDFQMPGMNGIELIGTLRRMGGALPVVVMTGADTRDLCTAAEAYGAVQCLTKPINLDQLIWVIESTLACQGRTALPHAAAV